MKKFQYTAIDVDGKLLEDTIEAIDEESAREELLLQNLALHSIGTHVPIMQREMGPKKKVKPIEILHFSRQMAAFVRAGLSVVDGLDIISRSTTNPTFAQALRQMRDDVRQGVPFDDALAQHHRMLPRYYLGVVRSASLTGRLDEALEQLSLYMERDLDARNRMKAALAYPLVIIGMSFVSVVILTVWVLPKFVDLFKELGSDLPFTTRTLINLANWSQHYWYVFLIGMALLISVVMWTRRSEKGRRIKDGLLFRLPVVGEIILFAGVERVCRILATLWRAGVPVADAMAAAIDCADNTVFEDHLLPVQEAVLAGEGFAEPLAAANIFPDAAVQMIQVGEASGTLAEQLENSANFYGRELEYKLKRMTTYFEPLVVLIVGVVVGFVALALVQAMYGSLHSTGLQR
jgi:type IV pilus assembly protein PilC